MNLQDKPESARNSDPQINALLELAIEAVDELTHDLEDTPGVLGLAIGHGILFGSSRLRVNPRVVRSS